MSYCIKDSQKEHSFDNHPRFRALPSVRLLGTGIRAKSQSWSGACWARLDRSSPSARLARALNKPSLRLKNPNMVYIYMVSLIGVVIMV